MAVVIAPFGGHIQVFPSCRYRPEKAGFLVKKCPIGIPLFSDLRGPQEDLNVDALAVSLQHFSCFGSFCVTTTMTPNFVSDLLTKFPGSNVFIITPGITMVQRN